MTIDSVRQWLAGRWAPNYVAVRSTENIPAPAWDPTTMALQSAAVWSCLRLISESISALPAHLYRETPTGKVKAIDDPAYPVLCRQPNALMTFPQWIQTTVIHLLLYGNAFSLPNLVNGELFGMWPLDPRRMRITWNSAQQKYKFHYYDGTDGGSREIDPLSMMHFRIFSLDGVIGLSPLDYQRLTIDTEAAARNFAASLYNNGGQPSGILEYPGTLKEPQIAAIRNAWAQNHAGAGNAGRVAVLDGGTKFQPISLPLDQLQFIASQKMSTEQIARIFGVPPHMIGAQDRTPYASVEQQSLEFSRYTVQPIVVSIERTIETTVLRPPLIYRLNLSAFERADIATRYRAYATGRQWGWFSVNDIRRLEDMDLIGEQGDIYLQPLNMLDAGANADDGTLDTAPVALPTAPEQPPASPVLPQ